MKSGAGLASKVSIVRSISFNSLYNIKIFYFNYVWELFRVFDLISVNLDSLRLENFQYGLYDLNSLLLTLNHTYSRLNRIARFSFSDRVLLI